MAAGEVYEFGPYALDVGERLWIDGHVVPLTPKAHDVLVESSAMQARW